MIRAGKNRALPLAAAALGADVRRRRRRRADRAPSCPSPAMATSARTSTPLPEVAEIVASQKAEPASRPQNSGVAEALGCCRGRASAQDGEGGEHEPGEDVDELTA